VNRRLDHEPIHERGETMTAPGMLAMASALASGLLIVPDARAGFRGFCSETAHSLFTACHAELTADRALRKGICYNIADEAARDECWEERDEEFAEGQELCKEQKAGRLAVCKRVGESRYDPGLDPDQFEKDYANLQNPNPYFPLAIGNRWDYRGGDESTTVEILNETKLIEGITCVVARDEVLDGGDLVEDTDDWFCQRKDGSVWYLGEEAKNYETFEGDSPRLPELVDVDGSFKAGRDGDQGGIIFLAAPAVGDVYVEEFSPGNAEDVAEVLSTSYAFGGDPDLDEGVPQALAEHLCGTSDCVVTRNFTALEPGISAASPRESTTHGALDSSSRRSPIPRRPRSVRA
jgi:hypothetical protein